MIKALAAIVGAFLTFLIDCLIVKVLWNYLSNAGFWPLLPSGVQQLTYVKAMALLVLFNVLVKSHAKKS